MSTRKQQYYQTFFYKLIILPIYASSIAIKQSPKQQQYFEGNKKGEVNELKILVKNIINEKDDKKKREVVKKVIAFMTSDIIQYIKQGIDISKLFTKMCMASYTNDLVQKKMIYLYLTTYAEQNNDMAFMPISTFQKDCKHSDPQISGFALRYLCSLRFSGAIEYLMPAISNALTDIDPYVRKTAIMGCVKVYYMQTDYLNQIVEQLYKLISNKDPLIIIHTIQALDEILAEEGGMALSKKLVDCLLGRLKDFNEWGWATTLDELSKYQPKDDKEMFNIMNLLEERLRHSCSAIVLAKNKPQIYEQDITRVKGPLLLQLLQVKVILKLFYNFVTYLNLLHPKDVIKYLLKIINAFSVELMNQHM